MASVFLSVMAGSALAQYGAGPLDIIRWSTFKSGPRSEVKGPLTQVINNATEFQTYWSRSFGDAPQSAPGGVDWLKDQLVAIHLGERSTAGFEVRVNSIKRTHAAEITIEYVEVTPAKGSLNAQMITSPWVIVRMQRSAGNLVFKKTSRAATAPIQTVGCGCCSRCSWVAGPPIEILRPIALDFPNPYGQPSRRQVWWREFDSGESCEIPGFGMTVMRNITEMGKYWMRLTGLNKTPWNRGPVDWMTEQLVAINVGKMVGSGHRVWVDDVERTGANEITIRYTVGSPAIPSAVAGRSCNPYTVIKMERNIDNLVFVRRSFWPSAAPDCGCTCGRCKGH